MNEETVNNAPTTVQLETQHTTHSKVFLEDPSDVLETPVTKATNENELEEVAVVAPRKPANHLFDDSYTTKGYTDFDVAKEDTVVMPTATVETINANLKAIPNQSLANNARAREWWDTLKAGSQMTPLGDAFADTLANDDALWAPDLKSEVGNIKATSLSLKIKPHSTYTGSQASLRIRQAAGLGTVWAVPLFHSGFWVTLRSAREGDLLELERRLGSEKIALGHATYGLAFSNTTVYTNKHLLDFIVDHVHLHSVDLKEDQGFRELIQTADMPLLVQALARVNYPNGFQYQRSCIAEADKCNHIVREKIDIGELTAVDRNSFTKHQVKHMSNRAANSMTLESLKRYRDDFLKGQPRQFTLNENIQIVLQMPTADAQIAYGLRWVSGIEEQYGQSLTMSTKEREEFLYTQAKATDLRQYAHMVTKIIATGIEYDGSDEIENALDDFSTDNKLREVFLKEVKRFLTDSVVAITAIPSFTCPACGQEQRQVGKENDRFPDLIAIDPVQTFFTLLVQKAARIQYR